MKPTVLVATTARWVATARLAVAFSHAGYSVEAVCPPGHPLGKTSVIDRTHPYDGLAPLASFADAIAATKPDLVVPGDDLAARHLHDIHSRERLRGKSQGWMSALIERSLGTPESFPLVFARTALMDVAHAEGVRVPRTRVVADASDLRTCMEEMGLPMVLKADGTSGGEGVRIVHTVEEAERALRVLQAPPLLARAGKRALIDRDRTLIWPSLLRRRFVVNAQESVSGREATSAIACWRGNVLAGLHFKVLSKRQTAGPATVLRLIDNPEMADAAEKMVRRLNLSGIIGLDFMLQESTGNAYLIEMNPRATQVGHLTLGPGRDIPATLYAAVSGQTVREGPKLTDNEVITLFPHEWTRNPASAFLRSGYHDIPWEEPELIRACLRSRQGRTGWYSFQKWFHALSPIRISRS